MIAIQVAIGIVLAYVIIVNQSVLLRFGKGVALFLTYATILAIGIYLAVVVFQSIETAASPYISKLLPKIGTAAFVIVFFIVAAVSGFGLSLLWHWVRKTEPTKLSDGKLMLFAFANMAIVTAAFYALEPTPLGNVQANIEHWSRSNGYKDLGAMSFFTLFLPWPFIPLWFVGRGQRQLARSENDSPDAK